ncbi:DUF7666 domain-containing protein [Aliihoeflea sp. PC F10.4]
MIERHGGRQQVICDTCPASYPNTYADEDFRVMIADAKTTGWRITKVVADASRGKDTADLFGSAPRIAGPTKPQDYSHKCPNCQHAQPWKACAAGFHACEHPLDVLKYYPPATSRFAVVELAGATARESGGDSKIAAAEITIKAEIRLPELIAAAVKFVTDRAKWIDGHFATGEKEGVSNKADGGSATASGFEGKARGNAGCAIFLVERSNSGDIVNAWTGIAGRDGIEPNTFYRLVDSKPVKVD